MPAVTTPEGWRLARPFRAPETVGASLVNSARTYQLIRAGNLYLSLQDAIALALENNLDIQVARYMPLMARTEIQRAKGGGLLRGIDYAIRELPPGEGGPGGPLITTVGGDTGSTSIAANNNADATLVTGTSTEISILNPLPASNGSPIPQFDPTANTYVNWQHTSAPQVSFNDEGTNNYVASTTNGGAGFTQGFSTGGSLNATYTATRTNSNSGTDSYNPYTTAALGFTFTQPLLQGFGIDLNRRFIRIAEKEAKTSDAIFRLQLVATVYSVIRIYWDYVSLLEDIDVKKQALVAAQKLYDDNKSQVEVGTLAPLQLKRAQAEVARTRQDQITSQGLADQQEVLLRNIITRSGSQDPSLLAVHIIPLDRITVPETEDIGELEDLVDFAVKNRPDLDAERLQMESIQLAYKGSRNELLPQLNLVVSATNNAFAGSLNSLPDLSSLTSISGEARPFDPALIGGTGTLLEQLFRRNYPNYGVGFSLTIPLRNRVAQADAARDLLQLRQSEARLKQNINQVRVEVENARLAVLRARASYAAASETRSLQEDALQAEQERLSVGQSTTFNVIQFERDLEQAKSTQVIAAGVYVKAKAALDRVMGRILRMNGVKLEEGISGVVPQAPTPIPADDRKP
jgi:outer membrane protein TolC